MIQNEHESNSCLKIHEEEGDKPVLKHTRNGLCTLPSCTKKLGCYFSFSNSDIWKEKCSNNEKSNLITIFSYVKRVIFQKIRTSNKKIIITKTIIINIIVDSIIGIADTIRANIVVGDIVTNNLFVTYLHNLPIIFR